jgi:DNA-directed RNA polymerase II subunit RPB1
MFKFNNLEYNPSKIIGIQFGLLSPDDIRNTSVAEITTRDTYDNNKPKIGGLFDPRMGVLEPGFICPTDGLDYVNTPGYFGHIELAKPVFYVQYLNTVMKILKCVCFKCSKLKVNKEKYKKALNMPSEERWNYVFQLSNKVNRCGNDTHDGCGCKQPSKIRKELGKVATLWAEWDNLNPAEEKVSIKLHPEMVLKIFKRISNDDIIFMGFSPHWSRPDWMICQVLAVPPPAVRPSVKHDAQQRSEDDITHILCNIIKTNNTLKDKLSQKTQTGQENIIEDWTTVLQYYVATLVDNNLPGVSQCCQRSGRPLKSIKERLNGKTGRVRGNLMGKRVDFSARSVITADPTLSIKQLGIPEKIAKNITKPVVVNSKNIKFLTKLVMNGPDNWPGAKILEKKNSRQISLRYVDKTSIQIEEGDIVHRHMLDGDAVLFNRQPTLHRMSMMCHVAKVMKHGDTFRMNVADTKPYNADFDGDEMNLHMPQDSEAESELRNLAAVPYQIVSPANNSCIVGIFQDSLLGAYQFTRNGIVFTKREAMNLLMCYNNVDVKKLSSENLSSFDMLSQIMPEMSLKYKTKLYESNPNPNNILEIENGKYISGQMEKGVLGSGSKGLLHRVCNDYGNMKCADFIDDFQNIITEYMKTSSFSVGVSDLLSNETTKQSIETVISEKKNDVKHLIEQLHIGMFANETGKSNSEEFETRVNNILNQASAEAGKIGRNNLNKDNRFVTMVNAGSKGSDLNISFMIACLGQQNVQGKRIPYGFNSRTLPHYSKFDDTPRARGFVENSYINGLDPDELFFHAMGGRTGLIDTAVKTSQTGYIQRRLIKGLEDLKVEYDMTVRNNLGKIVQFVYGDDGIDSVKIENQTMPLVNMSNEDIYLHYHIIDKKDKENVKLLNLIFSKQVMTRLKKEDDAFKQIYNPIIEDNIIVRDKIVTNVNKESDKNSVHIPVGFYHIINSMKNRFNLTDNSIVDITPLECYNLVQSYYDDLKLYYLMPNKLFETMYFYHLSPKNLLILKRFNKQSLIILLETITLQYKKSIVAPGEMVGMIAAQSIGEPTTQMTLNTFHFAGVSSKSNVTRGVPRIEEILSLTENVKNPSLTIHLKENDDQDKDKALSIMNMIENTKLEDIVDFIEIRYDPNVNATIHEDDDLLLNQFNNFENMIKKCNEDEESDDTKYYKWIVRMKLLDDIMLEKNITINDIHYCIKEVFKDDVKCCFSDYNDDNLIFRISLVKKPKKTDKTTMDQSDDIHTIKMFQHDLLKKVVLRGVPKIEKVIMRKMQNILTKKETKFVAKEKWVLDTVGSNLLEVLALDFIDSSKTITNNIIEVYHTLGIEAARSCIFDEVIDVISFDGTYINSHHIDMLCDRMCYNTKMISIFRHGINNDTIGPLAKASFEETPEMFLKAARHAELDNMVGVSANIMCGQEGYFGTGAFQTILDVEKFNELEYDGDDNKDDIDFTEIYDDDDDCNKLIIENNVNTIPVQDEGDDDYIPDF